MLEFHDYLLIFVSSGSRRKWIIFGFAV